jgi:hypothetical protein
MSKRLYPYRSIDPRDIVGSYALADSWVNNNTSGTGYGDEGVFVSVSAGDLSLDPITFASDSYQGKTDYNAVGWNQRSSVTRKIKPAVSGEICLGVTLAETALYDENGQYLSRYAQKVVEQSVVLKGDPVPVATRGELMLSKFAVDGTLAVGTGFKLSTVLGKVTGCAGSDPARIGVCLGSGYRGTRGTYVDAYSGNYYLVNLGL